jgi:polysaccharide deacetylase family protein (PEP-CTERM system associated)
MSDTIGPNAAGFSAPLQGVEFSRGAEVRRNARTGHDPAHILNAMTVDVEDYFHVQAFAGVIDRRDWDGLPRRVEQNTDRLLHVFADAGIKATFFTLGWVAERHPSLIRRITSEGHELASHGYAHIRADGQSPAEFREDVRRAKRLLEEAGGAAVHGYRAATFSIGAGNWWAFQILAEEGYTYSSSIFPVRHDLYGVPDAPRVPFQLGSPPLTELPLTTVRLLGRNLPCAGGGYFRLLPYQFSRWAMRRVNQHDRLPCIFYLHPWEVDPDQPRQGKAPLKSRLRHYTNLAKTEGRLRRLLREFHWGRMDQAFGYELGRDA